MGSSAGRAQPGDEAGDDVRGDDSAIVGRGADVVDGGDVRRHLQHAAHTTAPRPDTQARLVARRTPIRQPVSTLTLRIVRGENLQLAVGIELVGKIHLFAVNYGGQGFSSQ